jgi:hypothetical protein
LVEFKHAAYLTEAASLELLIAIENLKPQIFDYRLPAPMSLIAVLQLLSFPFRKQLRNMLSRE